MGSDWAELPKHLLELVFERLESSLYFLRSSVVCKSWHSTAKDNAKLIAEISTCHPPPPMLLIPTGTNGTWRLYNVMEDKLLSLQLKLGNKRFCGSSRGWLISIDQNRIVTLTNPLLRVKGKKVTENSIIHLPPLAPPGRQNDDDMRYWVSNSIHKYFVFKATISADPILNANECIVFVIYEDSCQLAFIRLHKNATWTYLDQRCILLQEVVPFRDQFWAVNHDEFFFFDICTQSDSDLKLVSPKGRLPPQASLTKAYLVEVNGKLLMVQREVNRSPQATTKFEVYELDYDKYEWVRKETLGDIALFLGDNSSIYVPASEFPKCQSECIYFSHDYERIPNNIGSGGPNDLGVYNVATKSFISEPFNKDVRNLIKNSSRQPPIWIIPRLRL